MEPELATGSWLVLNFAVWSGSDRIAIQQAVDLGRQFGGEVQVGIRPFDHHDEIRRWCPEVTETAACPLWILLCNGACACVVVGMRSDNELAGLIDGLLGR